MGLVRERLLQVGTGRGVVRDGVRLVLSGHRHVPYVWPIAGMLLMHSGSASTLRTRGFPHDLIRVDAVGSRWNCAYRAANNRAPTPQT